ncbi:MAG TPA: PEPxxWA-CTERM sorting domain-containing protein [Sphingobium sp.]|nr:PEPxxWA-CTERM sorting domain-containing protein [Sphingobium sp.]
MSYMHKIATAVILGTSLGSPVSAATFLFNFAGSGVSGSVALTYEPNPNTDGPLGTSPNLVDPDGSFIVTGATGSFADSNIGLATTITGVVASNPSNPEATNLLAPASFGHYLVASGAGPDGTAPGLSYDNLFYPDGSPQTASDYPFHGGFLDIYGLVFTTSESDNLVVNFWSNGDTGNGVSYGAGVTDGNSVLSYVDGVSVAAVPEPATWALMIAGFGMIGAAMRRQPRVGVRFA